MSALLIGYTTFVTLLLRPDHLQPKAPDALSLLLDAGGFIAVAVDG